MAAESDSPAAASGMWRWAVSKAEEFKGEMFDPQRAIHNAHRGSRVFAWKGFAVERVTLKCKLATLLWSSGSEAKLKIAGRNPLDGSCSRRSIIRRMAIILRVGALLAEEAIISPM